MRTDACWHKRPCDCRRTLTPQQGHSSGAAAAMRFAEQEPVAGARAGAMVWPAAAAQCCSGLWRRRVHHALDGWRLCCACLVPTGSLCVRCAPRRPGAGVCVPQVRAACALSPGRLVCRVLLAHVCCAPCPLASSSSAPNLCPPPLHPHTTHTHTHITTNNNNNTQ
jgi:hypothetical protein